MRDSKGGHHRINSRHATLYNSGTMTPEDLNLLSDRVKKLEVEYGLPVPLEELEERVRRLEEEQKNSEARIRQRSRVSC